VLRKALQTDDGRRLLADALDGAVAPMRATLSPLANDRPYADLPSAPLQGRSRPRPIFTTGRFRSGSTLLWNLFRHVPNSTSYYEPLNERRWFDPATRGDRVDRTHLGVTDYWREYDGLSHLGRYYRVDWINRRLYMGADAWDADLEAYVDGLVEAAPGRAVLQFNRVDFRLPWLRQHFPHARFIHMYRHPRDQWVSSLVQVKSFPREGSIQQFEAHDHFYLLAWAHDLACVFPFLDPRRAEHPYDLFYWIWKLSYLFGRQFCDASFAFETLCASPDQELARLMAAAEVDDYDLASLKALIVPQRSKWHQYADQAWFEAREARCEAVLEDFLGRPSALNR
jgi:hypothetical protein